MENEINYSIWNNISQKHEQKIGTELYYFLFKNAKPLKISEDQIIILMDDFTLKFLNNSSNNFFDFKNTCNEILYKVDIKIIFDSLNNKNKYIKTNTNSTNPTSSTISTPLYDDSTNINPKNNFIDNYVNEHTIPNYEKFEENNFIQKKTSYNHDYEKTHLISSMTFNNFFYSYENKQVIKGAQLLIQEIENPTFNPFFIYGVSGIGKTHILHAIGNEIFNLYENKNILYLHSTNFIEEYTSLFKGGLNNTEKIEEFKNKYFNIDVLLIDDIQLLESKEGSLNEFFAIFERLRNNNKIIIIASDKHPNKIHFEERLITRFLSGLNSEVKLPDTDTKKQIFSYYASERDINVTEEAINVFIEYSSNVRTLLGYLNSITISLIANDLDNYQINKDEAIKILNNSNGNPNKLTENDIIKIIIDHFKISKSELLSKSRKKNIVDARHFCAYFLRDKLDYKQVKISYVLNFNDHSAALNAIKTVKKKIKTEKYKKDFEKISQIMNN